MEKEIKNISSVHERDLENLLSKIGLFERFKKGEFNCKFCKVLITKDNIYSLIPESGMINFICNNPACVVSFSEYISEKEKGNVN